MTSYRPENKKFLWLVLAAALVLLAAILPAATSKQERAGYL